MPRAHRARLATRRVPPKLSRPNPSGAASGRRPPRSSQRVPHAELRGQMAVRCEHRAANRLSRNSGSNGGRPKRTGDGRDDQRSNQQDAAALQARPAGHWLRGDHRGLARCGRRRVWSARRCVSRYCERPGRLHARRLPAVLGRGPERERHCRLPQTRTAAIEPRLPRRVPAGADTGGEETIQAPSSRRRRLTSKIGRGPREG